VLAVFILNREGRYHANGEKGWPAYLQQPLKQSWRAKSRRSALDTSTKALGQPVMGYLFLSLF
jgi:hypothetical protein